ncbi:hypothetical protein BD769DRAFT_1457466 [Suillus cothurnatus]|nr:hypothetical protein BD769DRAFT_1457466 [Suillus cothurnatus]
MVPSGHSFLPTLSPHVILIVAFLTTIKRLRVMSPYMTACHLFSHGILFGSHHPLSTIGILCLHYPLVSFVLWLVIWVLIECRRVGKISASMRSPSGLVSVSLHIFLSLGPPFLPRNSYICMVQSSLLQFDDPLSTACPSSMLTREPPVTTLLRGPPNLFRN